MRSSTYNEDLCFFLNSKYKEYNRASFILNDPIQIPHQFSDKEDIEISAFLAAIFAWGQRKTIIKKSNEFLKLMDNAPYDFILNHQEKDLNLFKNFKHRTFNAIDAAYCLRSLQNIYSNHGGLEKAFSREIKNTDESVKNGLIEFKKIFFSLTNSPRRTEKHISSPEKGSACKRLNMFLRWMVRKDSAGVDFGIWHDISPNQLICPCDVHVLNVAKKLKLIGDTKATWNLASYLTQALKMFDTNDPVKFDFALFGLGVEGFFED